MAAVVAVQMARRLVYGHAHIAVRAIGQPSAIMAFQGGRVPTAVQEYEHLVASGYFIANGDFGFQRKTFGERLAANIQQLNFRRFGVARARARNRRCW